MDGEEILRMSRRAARVAMARLGTPVSAQDYCDMVQAAALQLVAYAGRYPGRSEWYYHVAARRAALEWLLWWHNGWNGKAMMDQPYRRKRIVSLDERLERGADIAALEQPEDETPDRDAAVLYEIFGSVRQTRGQKEIMAIERDVRICLGLLDGQNNDALANECRTTTREIVRKRYLIRNVLRTHVDSG